jgi:hypothetical protein
MSNLWGGQEFVRSVKESVCIGLFLIVQLAMEVMNALIVKLYGTCAMHN